VKAVVAALAICVTVLHAQTPGRVEYACTPDDIESFGLGCTDEDPCPVFLDLSSVQGLGERLFLSGNLHTANTTLYSVLLMSEDGGKTWAEAYKRVKSAALEQIQFFDFEHGWVGGQIIEPLAKDPFFLLTTDGGKTWRESQLFEDSIFGTLSQFWFDSPTHGELVFDRSVGNAKKYDLYETTTGGESWSPTQSGSTPIHLKNAPAKPDATFRVRTDAATKTFRIERRGVSNWELVASFLVHVADCQ
jgi:photosystem II stability/assembly factor-like uncharacterized protein